MTTKQDSDSLDKQIDEILSDFAEAGQIEPHFDKVDFSVAKHDYNVEIWEIEK